MKATANADLEKQSSLSYPKEAEAGITEVDSWHQRRCWSDLNFTQNFNAVITNSYIIDFFYREEKVV